ncbi:DegT/DnrJ/EryC1/StrS family aminotransferase [Chloroflexota bacterium]
MNRPKIPILRLTYTPQEIDFITEGIVEVLKSGYLTMGEKVNQFERAFAEFVGVRYAVATNSGTSSLEITLRAIGIEGSSVIIPSNTFIATATAVVHAGGKVVFADCQKENFQINPADLKRKINADTRGVILVHIGGMISPYLDEIKNICDENDLFLLEDAAHAHGATIDNRQAGSLGSAGSFSFYPTKVLVTAEGGMITTDEERIYKKALVLRDHGKESADLNVHTEFGYNWRFSELHAVLGLQQLKKVDAILAERRKIARHYDEGLERVRGISRLEIPENIQSSYYKYIVLLDDGFNRDEVKTELQEKYGISLTGEVYAHPCHSQPVFKKYPWTTVNYPTDTFPQTEYIAARHICLPLYPGLTAAEIDYIVDSLEKVLQ